MSKIRVLPENISNRIAAGEVIERPASVVKELVENAIDAGATVIKVEIERCGIKLIRVADDGSGMDSDDALLCLEQHATSKISKEKDIEQITSLGFRGEALPSIAAVSRFRLKTRTRDAFEGSEVIVDGGRFISAAPTGCAPGTEITVRDLFYNTPARKKFLKSEATEEKHIQEMLYMLALPYPGIAFSLQMDGKEIFFSPASETPLPRLNCFFGKSYAAALLPVAFAANECKIHGFAATHGFTRTSRREQRTFVNGRGVESLAVYNGIRDGYSSMVERGRFPPVVLFLSVAPESVDVNVHPAKREVRFSQERTLSAAVAESIRTALRQSIRPSLTIKPENSLQGMLDSINVSYPTNSQITPDLGIAYNAAPEPAFEQEPDSVSKGFPSNVVRPRVNTAIPAALVKPAAAPDTGFRSERLELPGSGLIRIIGFLNDTYILAADNTGLMIIDQHAAHERVMFELLLKGVSEANPAQKLLLPVTIELSKSDAAFIAKNYELFKTAGFEIEAISGNSVMVCSIPAALRQENLEGMLAEIISEMTEDNGTTKKNKLEILAGAACKAAVKANDRLNITEAEQLIRQMAKCELPFSCPHGRPTIINISVNELEKRFGRK